MSTQPLKINAMRITALIIFELLVTAVSALADNANWNLGSAPKSHTAVTLANARPPGLNPEDFQGPWLSFTDSVRNMPITGVYRVPISGRIPSKEQWPQQQPLVLECADATTFAVAFTLETTDENMEAIHKTHFDVFRRDGDRILRLIRPNFTDTLQRAFDEAYGDQATDTDRDYEVSSIVPLKWLTPNRLLIRIEGSFTEGGETPDCSCLAILEVASNRSLFVESVFELQRP